MEFSVTTLKNALVRRWCRIDNAWFDFRHGIETGGFIPRDALQTDSPSKAHATAYDAVWCNTVRRIVRQCRRLKYQPEVFLDIGCGKGRACFVAAASGRFRHIVGIDFDASLIAKALRNQRRFGAGVSVEFLHGDALQYRIAERPTLIFLFNPFDGQVLREFLQNNDQVLRSTRSIIAYANDMQRAVLEELGYDEVFSEPARKLSLWRAGGSA